MGGRNDKEKIIGNRSNCFFLLLAGVSAHAISATINLQGRLTDAGGNPR